MSDDLDFVFDADSVAPAAAFEPIPPGTYGVQIVQAEKRANNAGTGAYLWLEMEIIEGEFANRKLWHRLNIWSASEQAKQISLSQLSALCHAINTPQIRGFDQLVMKPFAVIVKVKPAGNDKQGVFREAQNEVKGFKALGPSTASARPAAPAAPRVVAAGSGAARPAANAGGAAPWGRRPN